MNRPYVICHILSSLDGKINGLLWRRMQQGRLVGNMEKSAQE